MNNNLSPFANFGAYIHDLLSMYLLPVGLPIAIIVVLMLVLIGRGKALEGAALEQAQTPLLDTVQIDTRPAILVVDDSAVARAKLSKLFETGGYRVELAKDGLEAMEKLQNDFFAVLVTDLEMPNMNGLELIAAVQGSMETEDLPIIAITGHDELQARVHDYQGLFGIFKKPWNDRELLKRVETLAVLRTKRTKS
jgi:CheY-like chemotaxis protein